MIKGEIITSDMNDFYAINLMITIYISINSFIESQKEVMKQHGIFK